MTKAQMIEKLTEMGVACDESMVKAELESLLLANGGDVDSATKEDSFLVLSNFKADGVFYKKGERVKILSTSVQSLVDQGLISATQNADDQSVSDVAPQVDETKTVEGDDESGEGKEGEGEDTGEEKEVA